MATGLRAVDAICTFLVGLWDICGLVDYIISGIFIRGLCVSRCRLKSIKLIIKLLLSATFYRIKKIKHKYKKYIHLYKYLEMADL